MGDGSIKNVHKIENWSRGNDASATDSSVKQKKIRRYANSD